MRKIFISLILFHLFLTSCAITGLNSRTGPGSVFTDVTESISNSATTTGSKQGEACAMNILGIASIGDASIIAARKNGGISKVATVDAKYFNVLALFGKYCTIVTGE
jgi:hypothetical protein